MPAPIINSHSRLPFSRDLVIQSTDDAKAVYDHIYRSAFSDLGPYGSHTNRDQWFLESLIKYLPVVAGQPAPRVLDASCGRGHLALSLKELGYDVEVTEISRHLIEEVFPHTMQGIPYHLLAYDELDKFPAKSFDAICSNDVLEHLPTASAVHRAFKMFAYLSRNLIFFCVGTNPRAHKYPRALGMTNPNLHLYVPPKSRWAESANKYFKQVEFRIMRRSAKYIGRVPE